jgi:hypothetical protein
LFQMRDDDDDATAVEGIEMEADAGAQWWNWGVRVRSSLYCNGVIADRGAVYMLLSLLGHSYCKICACAEQ